MFEWVTVSNFGLVVRVPGGWLMRGKESGTATYVPDPRVYHNRSNSKATSEAEELERMVDRHRES